MQESFASGCVPGMLTRHRLLHGPKYLMRPTVLGNSLVLGLENGTAIQILDQPYPVYVQSTVESGHFVIHTINQVIPKPVLYSELSSAVVSDALYGLQQDTGVSNETIEAFKWKTILAPCDKGIEIYRHCASSFGLTSTFNDFVNTNLLLFFP
jgi:hypothetical protein